MNYLQGEMDSNGEMKKEKNQRYQSIILIPLIEIINHEILYVIEIG